MISAGRVQQLGMEIGLLKRENEQLRHVMEDYKRVLFEMDEDLERCVALVKEYQIRYGELEQLLISVEGKRDREGDGGGGFGNMMECAMRVSVLHFFGYRVYW